MTGAFIFRRANVTPRKEENKILIHGKTERSSVNGPGERCAIWYQGCTLGCSGCWNPDTHAFDSSKRTHWIEITNWLENLPIDLEGITFSGGDPVQHLWDTVRIATWIRKNRPNWTIGMFTGYSYKEVTNGNFKWFFDEGQSSNNNIIPPIVLAPNRQGSIEEWNELESLLDYAVMGRYNKLLPTNLPLITTSNQELKLFTKKYTPQDFEPQLVEITIDGDNMLLTGFPVGADFSELIK